MDMKKSMESLNRTQQNFMRTMRRLLYTILFFVLLFGLGYVFVEFYPFIFSRKVHGVIVSVDRVQLNVSLMQATDEKVNPQIFSFAIAVREASGEIVTASAEDRQWAAANKGLCVEAVFYPYPPWKVMKSGTYFNARLDRLYECPPGMNTLPPPAPVGSPPPPPPEAPGAAQAPPVTAQPTTTAPPPAPPVDQPAPPPQQPPHPHPKKKTTKIPSH